MSLPEAPPRSIPVTVLTGFLGAGKTTLLNFMLKEQHGHKIAVIVNEFGEVDIDSQLIESTDEEVIGMSNGCICCTMRSDLLTAIQRLLKTKTMDYIVIETTGIADPTPIAQTFFNIPQLQQFVKLDSIVTVVDCEQIERQLRQSPTVASQIEVADFLVLSKSDLVDASHLAKVKTVLNRLNNEAMVLISDRGRVDLSTLLDVDAFDVERHLKRDPDFLDEMLHRHDDAVESLSFEFEGAFELKRFETFVSSLGEDERVFRAKGIVSVVDRDRRLIFHGVNNRFTVFLDRPWGDEPRKSQLVFIGKGLDRDSIHARLHECRV